jgi:hypothetical protein
MMKLEFTCKVERDGEPNQEFAGETEITEGKTAYCFKLERVPIIPESQKESKVQDVYRYAKSDL